MFLRGGLAGVHGGTTHPTTAISWASPVPNPHVHLPTRHLSPMSHRHLQLCMSKIRLTISPLKSAPLPMSQRRNLRKHFDFSFALSIWLILETCQPNSPDTFLIQLLPSLLRLRLLHLAPMTAMTSSLVSLLPIFPHLQESLHTLVK